MKRALLLLACLAASPAETWAQQPGTSDPRSQPAEVELGASHENLTNNNKNWSSVYLEAARTFRPRNTLYGGVRATRRFGLDDTEAYGGLYYPLSESWTGLVEATGSPQHNVLPGYSAFGQLQKLLFRGFVASAGWRYTEYTDSHVSMAVAGVEYYWSNFRAAYTFYSSRLDDAGSTPSHRFQLNHNYTDDSSVGVAYATGREVENVGPPVGLVTSDVRAWSVSGRHWFSKNWALSYEALAHEQGTFYRRNGIRLGLRHRF